MPVDQPPQRDLPSPEQHRSIQEQTKYAEADARYRTALSKKARQDLQGAMEECRTALAIDPNHLEARALFRDLSDILGHPGPLQADKQAQLYEVRRRQTIIEIESHLGQADRFYAAKEFDRALEELERARILILSVPEENAMGQLLAGVNHRIYAIKQSR